ncbi:uncharacterized protein LOC114269247 [Camellia sinensis]|uniref:uncharacterized protein LOC114269247 n=1 Tax=Camellia sinensis TaxID=4442 RepID=UPI00103570DE|nr:uncharacterized protein LOC114269247 [Camellia sinensis]
MVSLARSFRLQCIDVILQLQESRDADNVGSLFHSMQTVPCHIAGVFDDLDMDDEQDLLEKFCPHIDKVFLSAPWANGIQHIGQSFEGGASEFRNVLRKYAVECGFGFKFLKNDSVRITARAHCGVAVWTPKNPRAGSNLVSDVICERVSYRVAWLGVEKARGEMFGAHSISFDQLRWNSSVVMENNPGSYINIEYDEQNYRFIRANVLILLLGLFPVAIAIVDFENTTNWAWFLGHLANVVNRQRTLTFVSDRHAGLLESIPIIFPTAKHAFFLQHLQRNLQDKLRYVNSSYRSVMLAKFRACACAPTVAAFNQRMEEFTKCGRKVVPAFLKDLPPHYWANAYF